MKHKIAELKVSYKPNKMVGGQINSSNAAKEILRSLFNPDQIELREEFIMLLLNRANHVIGWHRISIGGLTGTVADPRLILGIALKAAAVSIILCHNHPSGNTRPSQADRDLTEKIKLGCKYVDLNLLDHIILTADDHLSFADEGLI